jgi:hypothetical protein
MVQTQKVSKMHWHGYLLFLKKNYALHIPDAVTLQLTNHAEYPQAGKGVTTTEAKVAKLWYKVTDEKRRRRCGSD